MGKSNRPEHSAPPEVYYDATEAAKYTSNSRITQIQSRLTERALELLNLPDDGRPRLVLDLGCGSGLSGEVVAAAGHVWVGMDISTSMLAIARGRWDESELMLGDLGQGVPFRASCFDGAISISAIQWLCNADTKSHDPRKRLRAFFSTLYQCLAKGARAVLQFYPENPAQAELISQAAMRAGFGGGMVVDYPNSTKAKKYYLVLMVGGALPNMPMGLGSGDAMEVDVALRQTESGTKKSKSALKVKGRGWILKKKQQMKAKGYKGIPVDSRYTGRKRRDRF